MLFKTQNPFIYLAALFGAIFVSPVAAQSVAGPEANPIRRMTCNTVGTIRADNGSCVDVETYYSTGTNTIYWVSQSAGGDFKPGTKVKPWKTIGRSTRAGVLKPGDVVIIREGVYRETIAPKEAGISGARITFAAYPGEKVVVSGADPMNDGWTASGNAWRHDWTLPLEAVPNGGTIADRPEFRREMVVADGKVLTPVFARSQVVPGTFYVEGSDVAPKAIYMRLPSDGSPSGHFIEVGRRSALFLPRGAREDFCGAQYGYYRVVGLNFRHAVNNANWGAVCSGREGSLLEENTVEWTNGVGIDLQGYDNLIRGNRANDNGMQGIGGRCTRCQIEYNETSRNNWKNHSYGYSSSGIKLIYSVSSVINRHLSVENNGVGIWLDMYNEDVVVENSIIDRSTGRGILLEWGTVRTTVRNNIVFGTRMHPSEGSGIQTQASSRNNIVHNTIFGNQGHGIFIRNDSRFENGYNTIYNNMLVDNAVNGGFAMAEIRIDGKTLSHIRTNVLDGNMYWQHPLKSGGNTFYGRTADGYLYRGNDLATWNWVTRSDLGAGILKRTIQQIADKSQSSGWQLVATSQALGRGRALPSGLTVLTDIIGNVRPPIAADVSAHQRGGTVSSPGFLFEAGTRKVSQSGPDEWHAVSLSNAYTAPVVLVSPLSYYGNQPATVRVRKVTSSGFEFQIDEWDYLEGAHKTETIHFAVFEAGRYPLTNGGELEAGIVNASSSFSGIPFTADFADIPVVLGQIVTANDVRAAAPRQRNVTSTRFELLIQGEETDRTHGDEKVAYVALTKGTGTLGSRAFVANTTAEGVNHTFLTVPFEKTFSASPIFLASMQTANGMDSATLRFRSLSDSSVDVMVEEEQSKDLEMTHGREVVGYLAFESESVLASAAAEEAGIDAKDLSGAEVANADTLGTTVDHFELLGNFPNPFNPETTIRYALPEETHVTLEVYDLLGRRVAVLVDSVQPAGTHGASFNAENLASGIYMYHLRAGSHARTAQMILMK